MARTQCFAEKRGSSWRGRYPDADGRLRSTSGCPTRNKALQAARAACAALEDGTADDAAHGQITLSEWVSQIWPAWDIELTTRANYSTPIRRFILPAFGDRPAEKRRRGYHTERWRVHCSRDPFPGIPVPMSGIHRAKAEQLAECSWVALSPGLTPHGLRHGHQTAMRRDRVPQVLRRDRLGHGPSGDIADHYTHIDDEVLSRQTQRRRAAVAARARIDEARGAGPRSAVPAPDEWLAPFRERAGESSSHLRSHRQDPEEEA